MSEMNGAYSHDTRDNYRAYARTRTSFPPACSVVAYPTVAYTMAAHLAVAYTMAAYSVTVAYSALDTAPPAMM